MMIHLKATILATGLVVGVAGFADAQTASGTVGSGGSAARGGSSATTLGTGGSQTGPGGASGTIAGGGSAAAGGTSASAVGTGGTQTGPNGTSSSIGSGGSAAGGRTSGGTKINGNDNNLMGQSKAMAHDGGTFSKVQEKTKVKAGEELSTRTKAMSHQPGGPPAKSTTRTNVDLNQ